jgi:hypothetical protein
LRTAFFSSGLSWTPFGAVTSSVSFVSWRYSDVAPALKEVTALDIPGVTKGGTKVVLLRDGLNGTQGVISMPDGSMLFTEQDANKTLKVDKNDNISTYLENTNRTIGLANREKVRPFAIGGQGHPSLREKHGQ